MMKRQSIEKRLERLEQEHQERPELLPASWRDMKPPADDEWPPKLDRDE